MGAAADDRVLEEANIYIGEHTFHFALEAGG
jgi:hypothetical protein